MEIISSEPVSVQQIRKRDLKNHNPNIPNSFDADHLFISGCNYVVMMKSFISWHVTS